MAKRIEGEIIGYQVKAQLTTTVISADLVKAAAAKHNLPLGYLCIPSKKRATARAANEAAKTHRRFRDHLTRSVANNPEKASWCILDEQHDESHDRNYYHQGATIRFDKNSGCVTAEGNEAMVQRFWTYQEKYENGLTTNDLRSFLYRVVRRFCNGVGLVPTGGLYFVPASKLPVLQSMDAFLRELCVGRLWYEPKVDCRETMEWLWDSAKREVTSQINKIMSQVAQISKRESSLQRKSGELGEQNALLEAYSELTGFGEEAEEISATIEDAIKTVTERISELVVV